ncbi:putative peptide transporter permease subunit: membrane component of ABC superfamily [uncultured Sporomusa sp.]|uniref:Nickel import system permease protein NikB n=1 Tax=uncultured Sporomusa sp. TaxID=307249 RepID=A0A212M0F8_9FIRM|nr:nickel ABC transporter permease [uncultured Sporomusa sp.]SCM83246.1 putative peptide transporter permease subunit: membrane component of ABC superfamily [uncultured Sporomusa sp.]
MSTYLFEKIAHFAAVITGISIIVFLLLALSPGDPARVLLTAAGLETSAQNIQQMREEMGLNKPLWQQYFVWLGNVAAGDWGNSYRDGQPVLREILDRFPATLQLAVCSVGVALCLAIPLGIVAALWQDKLLDHISRSLSLLGLAMPGFLLGLLLIYFFAVKLRFFPVTGSGSWHHLVLPSFTLGLGLAAVYSRFLRASLLEILGQDYIVAARARGIPRRRLWFNHILRNAASPFLTVAALNFGYLLGGSVIIEKIFAWPGLGKMVVDAIFDRNYPVVQGYVLFWAACFVTLNLLVDLGCAVMRPHAQLERDK